MVPIFIIDDYFIFTWVLFLANKDEPIIKFSKLYKNFQNEKGVIMAKIRGDHGVEFEKMNLEVFVNKIV